MAPRAFKETIQEKISDSKPAAAFYILYGPRGFSHPAIMGGENV
jgi:hypothetical protein